MTEHDARLFALLAAFIQLIATLLDYLAGD
jgi:hypothetical protein